MAVDTKLWNLTVPLGAVGLAACGPLVPVPGDTEGAEDDGTGADDDDGVITTGRPTVTATGGPGCGDGPPCEPGYACYNGACYYDYECESCCDGECGYYYECYSHDDCYAGTYCNYYSCAVAEELPSCLAGSSLSAEIIPMNAGTEGARALVFADGNADGAADLAVLRDDITWIVLGPSGETEFAAPVLAAGSPAFAVATDIDGPPAPEFTLSITESDSLLTIGTQGDTATPLAFSEPALFWPTAGDFDADGRDDIVGLLDGAVVTAFSEGTAFAPPEPAGLTSDVPVAVGQLGEAPGDDLVVSDGIINVAQVMPGGGSAGPVEESVGMANRIPVVGDFDGDGDDDIVGLGARADQALLAGWRQFTPGAFDLQPYFIVPNVQVSADGFYAQAVGDFDGNGAEDIAVGGSNHVTILFGANGDGPLFTCYAEIPLAETPRFMAAGDMDANGRSDLAYSDGETVVRILLSG